MLWIICHQSKSRPASRCGTEMWPDLRLKWPQVNHRRLDHTWQWHVTWVDFKRLQKHDSEWSACHYQKFCVISHQPGRKKWCIVQWPVILPHKRFLCSICLIKSTWNDLQWDWRRQKILTVTPLQTDLTPLGRSKSTYSTRLAGLV